MGATSSRVKASQREALPASFAGGRYVVEEFLGRGGRKTVYLACDARLDRRVAVAVVETRDLDEVALARVRREATAMARLGDHPNIVTIYDIAEEAGSALIISQYMAGGSVADLLARADAHRLPVEEAVRIAREVASALATAHGRGIVHRDLKPANVWLAADGSAKLGDFGLALDGSETRAEDAIVGTVAYMPPEQAIGGEAEARSDLYALGAMLYEMVCGRPPFVGDDAVSLIGQHVGTQPVAPSWHNADAAGPLEDLILRLLAKSPEDRPDTAEAVVEALDGIAEAPLGAGVAEERDAVDRLGGTFVGREQEIGQLRAALDEAFSGRTRLVMLVGESGIGKTRTAEQLAGEASLRGAQVLWGRCYEGEGAPSYWPWVQVIRSYVHERDSGSLASEMGTGAADIAQVVTEVRERFPSLPPPPDAAPEQARFRLFDSIATFLGNAAKARPIVLIIDDLHWADRPSLLLLEFLAREVRHARLLVVGAYRDVELGRQHPLSATLGNLAHEGVGERVLLRGLTEPDVARFIETAAGVAPATDIVVAVYRETEGNPFFVSEVVRLLVADDKVRLDRPSTLSLSIPQGVREAVGRHLDRLSPECNEVLAAASAVGREFAFDLLERVSERPSDSLLEALDEASRARVVEPMPGVLGRWAFTHALIRETLYEELSTAQRVRLHRRIAEALETIYDEGIDAHVAEVAYHFYEAAAGGDAGKAIDYASRAGARAARLLAFEEAAGHFERALQVLDSVQPDAARRCEILLGLGDALWRSGEMPKSRETYLRAADEARALGAAEALARAGLGYAAWLGTFESVALGDEVVVGLLEEALVALGPGDSVLRVRVLARLANEQYAYPIERRAALSQEAVEVAQRLGDRAALLIALYSRAWALLGPDGIEARLATAEETLRLATELGDREMIFRAHHFHATTRIELGDVAGAAEEFEICERLAEELRQPLYVWYLKIGRASLALFEGRFEEGLRLADEAFAVGQRTHTDTAMAAYGTQLFIHHWAQGRLAELEPAFAYAAQQYPWIPAFRCALALLHAETGREEEARAEVETIAREDFRDLPRDSSWLISLTTLSMTCVRLGDQHLASILYELLLPYAGRNVVGGTGTVMGGSASEVLGPLAETTGRDDDADRHFEFALAHNERMGSSTFVAWTAYQYAAALLARGAPQAREKGLAMLDRALDLARRIGMRRVAEQALALKLETLGMRGLGTDGSIEAVSVAAQLESSDLRARAASDGWTAIMFTDIEGSTAFTERLGDRGWLEVLRAHNAIVRHEVEAHGGSVVKCQGDGFMIAFSSAPAAVACAVAIQRGIASAHLREPIRVRIGLHAGEAIREGDDLFGKAVILAARICTQASGGEILVSSSISGLAGGFSFDDPEEIELKGLGGSHRVSRVVQG